MKLLAKFWDKMRSWSLSTRFSPKMLEESENPLKMPDFQGFLTLWAEIVVTVVVYKI
jgi:hypothetical protein